jgi:hypothetical protein
MTLKEAKEALDQRKIVTREKWLAEGKTQYLMLNGSRTQTVESLYSGQMKDILEAHSAVSIEFLKHYDLIVISPEVGTYMAVGYTFPGEDEWATDYIVTEINKVETSAEEQ